MKPSKKLKALHVAYTSALKTEQAIRKQLVPIQINVLEKMNAMSEGRRQAERFPIRDPKKTYLMSDVDANEYFSHMQKQHHILGHNLAFGYCPILIAEENTREARRNFIDGSQEINPIIKVSEFKHLLDIEEDYFQFTLKYVGQFIK